MSLERRLADLEVKSAGAQWELPIEVRILLKAVARHRARERGEEPPAYSREEPTFIQVFIRGAPFVE